MTKQEFIVRQKAMTKSSNKWASGFLAVFFGVLLAIALAARVDRDKSSVWVQVFCGVAFFGFLIGWIALLAWFAKWQQRRFRVLCPSCDKPLMGVSSQIAIATGNCGHCGESVFSE
jgi:hypothetical protein